MNPSVGDQLNLAAAVLVRFTMLDVDHADQLAARQHRHRQERVVAILGQLVEGLEARVLPCAATHRHRLAMFGHPPGDAFAHAQLQPADDIEVRRLRGAQHQVLVLEHVDEAGVTRHHGGDELHHALEHGIERVGRRNAGANLVKGVDRRILGHSPLNRSTGRARSTFWRARSLARSSRVMPPIRPSRGSAPRDMSRLRPVPPSPAPTARTSRHPAPGAPECRGRTAPRRQPGPGCTAPSGP